MVSRITLGKVISCMVFDRYGKTNSRLRGRIVSIQTTPTIHHRKGDRLLFGSC